jgi:hypothetical protein
MLPMTPPRMEPVLPLGELAGVWALDSGLGEVVADGVVPFAAVVVDDEVDATIEETPLRTLVKDDLVEKRTSDDVVIVPLLIDPAGVSVVESVVGSVDGFIAGSVVGSAMGTGENSVVVGEPNSVSIAAVFPQAIYEKV